MRRAFLLFAVAAVVLAALVHTTGVHAQDPNPVIDAVIQDMAFRTGQPLTKKNTNYTFEQNTYPDLSLGCPQPGVVYAPSPTLAWKIILNPAKTDVFYDYRAIDVGRFFLCEAKGSFAVPATVPPPTAAAQPTTANQPATAAPVVPGATVQPAQQPTAAPAGNNQPLTYQGPVIAYIGADGEVNITSMGINPGPTPLTVTAKGKRTAAPPFYTMERQYGSLQWSPDGNILLFSDSTTGGIYIARSGQPAIQIADKAAFPMWSPDGKQLAYAVPMGKDNLGKLQFDVQSAPTEGGPPQSIAQFFQECTAIQAAPAVEPADSLYLAETSSRSSIVQWTPRGLVYTPTCVGIGLALLGPDGKDVWKIPDITHVAISPDRTRAVGLKADSAQALLIDLNSAVITPLATKPGVDQFAWTPDGTAILYSTLANAQTVQGDPNAKLGKEIFPTWPLNGQAFNVSLWRVPVAGGDSVQLFSQEGRAIGNIAATSDNKVAFSFISSDAPFIKAINAGQPRDAALLALPTLKIGVTTLDPGAGTQAGFPYFFDGLQSGQPTFSKAAQYTAVLTPGSSRPVVVLPTTVPVAAAPTVAPAGGAASAPTNAAVSTVAPTVAGNAACGPMPQRMVVGQQGRITPGPANAINSLPARPSKDPNSKKLGEVPAGGVFTVMEGPVCGDDFTWWKLNYNGVVGWTAEGDAKAYWLEPIQPVQPTSTPAIQPCPGNLPPRLVVGKTGRSISLAGNALNSQPSAPSKDPNSKRLGTIPNKSVFAVVEGPKCANGYTWWKVNFNGTIGWTAEGDNENYWLEPVESETVG